MSMCKVRRLNVKHYRLSIFLLLITVFCLSLSAQASPQDSYKSIKKPYPGKLINIGSHRLHINCMGEGSPTIIIDSGIGGFSLEWSKVQSKLANDFKVCSYDRAGYGWSDPGPTPRTTARITRELRILLSEAKVDGPYIMVGHSFGGYNIRYFASEYPDLVAGMIFVDASHPEQFNTEEFKREKPKTKIVLNRHSVQIRIMHPVVSKNYPLDKVHTAYRLMSSFKSKMTVLNESDSMDLSAQQVLSHSNQKPYPFPVAIITRGKRVWAHNRMGDRREKKWANLQNDLENLALNTAHFMAFKSGHVVHLDQPRLVTEKILLTAYKARQQFFQKEIVKRDDFRARKTFDIETFRPKETTFELSSFNLDHYKYSNAPINITHFDPHLIFLRSREINC